MTDPDTPPPPASPTAPEPTPPARVDPEDWESALDDDERYRRERPPHWG